MDKSFWRLQDACEILTPYATLFRYPGGALIPEKADVEEAIDLANEAFKFVMEKMPDEVKCSVEEDGNYSPQRFKKKT